MRRAVGLAVVAAVLLTGCGGIPTSGDVQAGAAIDEEAVPDVGFLPQGPQAGASQTEILIGFIQAATNPADSYAVAKSFLTDELRDEWRPNAITQIRIGPGTPRIESDTSLTYTISTNAYVDASGEYVEEDQTTQVFDFAFAQNAAGEWRISSAPDGIVLSRNSFDSIFDAHPIYFFDPTYSYLVPDVRWFPSTTLLSTRIVGELLDGQAPYLQQGVTNSEFPTGTSLTASVTTESGVATVDLSEEALTADPQARERMRQQLEASLGSVSSVVITVNGVPIDVPDSGSPATIDPQVKTQLLLRNDGGFGFYTSAGGLSAVSGQSAQIVDLGATAVTLAPDGAMSAVLAPDGVHYVVADSDESLLVDNRGGLIAPSTDASGFVWSVPAADASAIRAFDATGTAYVIAAPEFAGAQAISMSVSRDGTRLLMLLSTSLGPKLFVAGILRREGLPYDLGEPLELRVDLTNAPLDATWVDDHTVAALAQDGDGYSITTMIEIGGTRTTFGRLLGGTSITTVAGGSDGLRVLTSDGTVYRTRGSSWANTSISASFLGTQQ